MADLFRFQVRYLRGIFNEMIRESYSNSITLGDVIRAKQKYPDELAVIRAVYVMRRQGRSDQDIARYLEALN